MEEVILITHHILDEHHKYYTKNSIDDTEMVKELRFILKGVKNYLSKKYEPRKDIDRTLGELKKYAKDKYMKTYINNFENSSNLSDEEKRQEASYYFDYVFKHGEHPH
jgi:hypothetical protein